MNFYRVFDGKIYVILHGFDYPCRPSMFARTQILKTKKGVVNHNIIFPPGVFNDGYQVTFHDCDDSGEVCQGRGEDSIFNREFL